MHLTHPDSQGQPVLLTRVNNTFDITLLSDYYLRSRGVQNPNIPGWFIIQVSIFCVFLFVESGELTPWLMTNSVALFSSDCRLSVLNGPVVFWFG